MKYRVQRLRGSDVAEAHRLVHMFGVVFEEASTYTGADTEYTRSVLVNPACIVLVALDGSEVVGGLVAYELKKLEQKRSEIYVYDLGVSENYRRQGVGTALIVALKPIARMRSIHDICAGRGRRQARHFALFKARE